MKRGVSELINGQMVDVDGHTGEIIKGFEDGSALIRFRLDQSVSDFIRFGPEVITRKLSAEQFKLKGVESHVH